MWRTTDIVEWQRNNCPLVWKDVSTQITGTSAVDLAMQGAAPKIHWKKITSDVWDWDIQSFSTYFIGTSVEPALTVGRPELKGSPLTWRSLINHIELSLANVPKYRSPALLLSGGIDSSIIAVVAKNLGVDLTAYHIGDPESDDARWARVIADDLSIPLRVINPDVNEVDNAMTSMVRLMGHPSPEFPLGAVALHALRSIRGKHDLLINGEPADALLGGLREINTTLPYEVIQEKREKAAYYLSPLSIMTQLRLAQEAGADPHFPFYSNQLVADSLATPWASMGRIMPEDGRLGGEGFKRLLQQAADHYHVPNLSRIARRDKIGLPATLGDFLRKTLPKSARHEWKLLLARATSLAFLHTLSDSNDIPFSIFMNHCIDGSTKN